MSETIRPPDDAPLPWKQGEGDPFEVFAANGDWVAEFPNLDKAAYAVAAANALPGAMEVVSAARDIAETGECWCEDEPEKLPCYHCALRAALAALPKEVRP